VSNTPISSLVSGVAVSDTDEMPDVQQVGIGPNKVTALQLKTYIGNALTLNNPILNNPVTINGVVYTFPASTGTNGYVLSTNGAGALSWIPQGVTSIDASGAGTGLTFSNGPITSSGVLTLGGVLNIAHGGTGGTTRQTALRNLLPPSIPVTAGYALFNDGAGDFYWAAAGGGGGGGGTIIAVNATPVIGGVSGRVVFDNTGLFGEATAITTNGVGGLALGDGVNAGSLVIGNSAAGSVTLQTGAGATNWTLSFPPNAGANNQVLTTSGTGVTSWTTIPTTNITVNTTPITGGANGHMVYDNGGTVGETTSIITDGAGSLVIGSTLGGTPGNLGLVNNTGKITVLTASPATPSTYTLTLPADGGTNGQFLTTDGTGVTSWMTVNEGIVVGTTTITSGTAGSIPFNNGTVYSENNANLFWDNTNFRLGIGTNAPTSALTVTSNALINNAIFGVSTNGDGQNLVAGVHAFNDASGTGTWSTAVGAYALWKVTGGFNNTAVGAITLREYTNQSDTTAVGYGALQFNHGALGFNTAVGSLALNRGVTGDYNTAVGYNSLYYATNNYNTALGTNSGSAITVGSANVILGGYTGATAPISLSGNNFIVLSDGVGNIGSYWDGLTGNMVNTGSVTAPSVIFPTTTPANKVTITSSNSTTASYTLTLPVDAGIANQVLTTNGAGILSWSDNLADPFTTGSVPFAGPSGSLIEDNSKFFWDDTNYRLGIGTNTPAAALTVAANDAQINGLTVGKGNNYIVTNTAFGANALLSAGVQTDNTAIGNNTLPFTTGGRNTAVGSLALYNNIGGLNNTAVGTQAVYSNQSGTNNTALGVFALATLTNNNANTAIGAGALNQIVGSQNTAIGANSGDSIPTGSNNTIVGRYRGTSAPFNGAGGNNYVILSDGDGNIRLCANSAGAVSFDAVNYGTAGQVLQSNGNAAVPTWVTPSGGGIVVGTTTITGGTAGSIPYNDGTYYTEDNANLYWDSLNTQLCIGTNSTSLIPNIFLQVAKDASINGITAGLGDGQDLTNTVFGASSFASGGGGSNNAAFGYNALSFSVGNTNTAFGSLALSNNTGANGNSGNTGIGYKALQNCSNGRNTAVGRNAMGFSADVSGDQNTAVGLNALANITSGHNNTSIGQASGFGITSGSNNVILGSYDGSTAPISGTGDNYIVLSDGVGNIGAYWDGTTKTQYAEGPIVTKGYLVSTLPAGVTGARAHVTDAIAPTFLGTLTGGGTVTCPVFYDGTAWVAG